MQLSITLHYLLTFKFIYFMKKVFGLAVLIAAFVGVFSCNRIENPQVNEADQLQNLPATKAQGFGLWSAVYVETNDVNPLNAMDYEVMDIPFFDIVELFASNIHKETTEEGEVRPTLYLNDKLTPVLENGGVNTYVRPLQAKGIKVLLTVLGDWQGIGVANMTDTQADQFAAILAYAVEKYGLDGIGFDDEYADYPLFGSGAVNNTSYSRIITKLHELMPSNKLITVFDWGNTDTISSEAAAYINYVYHGAFGFYLGLEYCNISGITNDEWSPISLNLGTDYNTDQVRGWAESAVEEGYGGMMCFNLRMKSDNNPLPELQALSDGAYGGLEVTCDNGDRPRDAGSVPAGYTITYDMATAE